MKSFNSFLDEAVSADRLRQIAERDPSKTEAIKRKMAADNLESSETDRKALPPGGGAIVLRKQTAIKKKKRDKGGALVKPEAGVTPASGVADEKQQGERPGTTKNLKYKKPKKRKPEKDKMWARRSSDKKKKGRREFESSEYAKGGVRDVQLTNTEIK